MGAQSRHLTGERLPREGGEKRACVQKRRDERGHGVKSEGETGRSDGREGR